MCFAMCIKLSFQEYEAKLFKQDKEVFFVFFVSLFINAVSKNYY